MKKVTVVKVKPKAKKTKKAPRVSNKKALQGSTYRRK